MSGTEWTAPGQGSTVEQIITAFEFNTIQSFADFATAVNGICLRDDQTNLHLTGSSITEEDWARLESVEFRVGE